MKGKGISASLWKDVALLLLAGIVAVLFASRQGASATAAPLPEAPSRAAFSMPAAPADEVWVLCTPVSVAALAGRVAVECSESYGDGVRFFAASTSDAAAAARYLSVLSTAQVAGRTLGVLYDPQDLSGASFGCAATDCRTLRGVGFGQ